MNNALEIEYIKQDIKFHEKWMKRHKKFVWGLNGIEYFVLGYFGIGILIRLMTQPSSSWLAWALVGLGFSLGFYALSTGMRYFLMRKTIQEDKDFIFYNTDKLSKLEKENKEELE